MQSRQHSHESCWGSSSRILGIGKVLVTTLTEGELEMLKVESEL